ncbi:hypothetical protein ACOL23_01100 [Aliarcobacter butzleri]
MSEDIIEIQKRSYNLKNLFLDPNNYRFIDNENYKKIDEDKIKQNDKLRFLIIDDVFENSSTISIILKKLYENIHMVNYFCMNFDRCLEKEELNNIENIYKSNTGYTLIEIVAKIRLSNISKVSELKERFINNKIFKQFQDKLEININYKNYFIVDIYRGNQIIKYKYDILDFISTSSIFGSVKC